MPINNSLLGDASLSTCFCILLRELPYDTGAILHRPPIIYDRFDDVYQKKVRNPSTQCRINHGADGARAGPPGRGAPEQNIFFLRQRELVVGCTAPHGTCLSWLRKALPKSEVVWKKVCVVPSSSRQIMFDCWPASLDWRFPSSDCGLRQPVRTVILLFFIHCLMLSM